MLSLLLHLLHIFNCSPDLLYYGFLHTSSIEPTVTNCDISDNNSLLKCVIPDVTGNMTSFMALDSVTLFFHLKDVTITCKCMRGSLSIGGSSSVQ